MNYAPFADDTKSTKVVLLLWAASRPGGISYDLALDIVGRGVEGLSGRRTVRRYLANLREMGFQVEVQTDHGGGGRSEHIRIAVRGVTFQIESQSL